MKFYYVDTEEGYADAYYDLQESEEYICDKCNKVYLSKSVADYRVHFEGKKIGDFYWAPGCFIGNEKFIAMLEKYNITGYGIRNIDCTGWYDRRGNSINVDTHQLREIEILGKCGFMCDTDGKVIEGCEKCGLIDFWTEKGINGLSVPLDKWDGSDIFMFQNKQGVMICTDRLKEACEKEKIRNICFTPIEEVKFS